MVESQPSKLLVASSILVSRSRFSTSPQGAYHLVTPKERGHIFQPIFRNFFQ